MFLSLVEIVFMVFHCFLIFLQKKRPIMPALCSKLCRHNVSDPMACCWSWSSRFSCLILSRSGCSTRVCPITFVAFWIVLWNRVTDIAFVIRRNSSSLLLFKAFEARRSSLTLFDAARVDNFSGFETFFPSFLLIAAEVMETTPQTPGELFSIQRILQILHCKPGFG